MLYKRIERRLKASFGWITLGSILLCCPTCKPGGDVAAPAAEASPAVTETSSSVKNLIVYIGDGMGPEAAGLLNAYAKYAASSIYKPDRRTALEELMAEGALALVYHDAADNLVTDSAASATQMASGERALLEAVGISENGRPVSTMLDKAKQLGKATGLVSDTRLTHATPAGFGAHAPHRNMENEIAQELIEKKIDVLLSGGLQHFIPRNFSAEEPARFNKIKMLMGKNAPIVSRRRDNRNLLAEAEKNGYTAVFSTSALKQAEQKDKILGLFSVSAMPYRVDADNASFVSSAPSLKQMTQSALRSLSKNQNGFFLMVESGIIDWAEHDNDAGALLHEMIRFDETLAVLNDFVKARNDTLLIVTADHDTGGFAFSYAKRDIPSPVPFPGNAYPKDSYAPSSNFVERSVLDKLYAQKMSYAAMFQKLDASFGPGADPEKKAEALMRIVNDNTRFPISKAEAKRILEVEHNAYRVSGNPHLNRDTVPRMDDFEEFFVYGDDTRRNILARVTAGRQRVVWSTGTHTSTPVLLVAAGCPAASRFKGFVHTTAWAKTALGLLR